MIKMTKFALLFFFNLIVDFRKKVEGNEVPLNFFLLIKQRKNFNTQIMNY
jgi:hypothetical protein